MGFKGADGTFGDAGAVNIVGHELVCGLPDVSDVATVLLADFVVSELVVNDVAALLGAGHDAGVCVDTVAILTGLEGFNEDDVGVSIVSGQCLTGRPERLTNRTEFMRSEDKL